MGKIVATSRKEIPMYSFSYKENKFSFGVYLFSVMKTIAITDELEKR